MTLPLALPDWLPWWVTLVVIVPALLFLLAFLFMPFSVFGVKGRLEGVEARLDEIQGEIRSLALRLPERLERYERDPRVIEPPPRRWAEDDRPPIPPAASPRRPADERQPQPRRAEHEERPLAPPSPYERLAEDRPPPPPTHRVDPSRGGRAEPRLGPPPLGPR
jgi:hypothetical protein